MPGFFIERPIFAWVIALLVMLAGGAALTRLPLMQYPDVAPPQVEVLALYPGASAADMDQSVVSLIEQALNGIDDLQDYRSQSGLGQAVVTARFAPGSSPQLAQVAVQNRLKTIESRLPAAVLRQGLQVQAVSSGFLAMVTLSAPQGQHDEATLNDYLARHVVDEIRRLKGVGKVQLYGAERAMRVWLDMPRLRQYGLAPADIATALQGQNAQIAAGSLGDLPGPADQDSTAAVVLSGQLDTPQQFAAIVLRSNADGSSLLLGDVARIEIGSQEYQYGTRLNGQPAAAFSVQLSPGANALQTSNRVRERLDQLARWFPAGMQYAIPYDIAPFVKVAVLKVCFTLLEAMVLVFAVMFVFLQNLRCTLIPALVVPIALLGTFAVMAVLGYSINVLTLAGMVLAIGILVDDAIVVVENVMRLMVDEGLDARQATHKAMGQISGAIIAITLVLTTVLVPMAFMPGATGIVYRQFSLSMATAILCSAFLALSLTPALCASLLRPMPAATAGWRAAVERGLGRLNQTFERQVRHALAHRRLYLGLFAALGVLAFGLWWRLPTAFLPVEDQGYAMLDIQLPPGASLQRTLAVAREVEAHNAADPAIANTTMLLGFGFSGSGQNAALAFSTFKDWAERGAKDSAQAIAERANNALGELKSASIHALLPPPIDGVGTSAGFELMLEDRGGLGYPALQKARDQLLALAADEPRISGLREDALAQTPQVNLQVDRIKASALGVDFAQVGELLATAVGSAYVNDFPNQGRLQHVVVQAEGDQRSRVADLLRMSVRNAIGQMVPLDAFVRARWSSGPSQLARYDGYPAISLSGDVVDGWTTGQAMAWLDQAARRLPAGIGIEWTGVSAQERMAGAQAPLTFGLSLLVVFLCLAALYESWSLPLAVLAIIPLAILGAVLAVTLRGMPDDLFFKVGLITTMGLSAKNAILIVDAARQAQVPGASATDRVVQAARLRLRPILMTSLAFVLGVLPLTLASGAGSAALRAMGTGVVGGMLGATLAVVLVPLFHWLLLSRGAGVRAPAVSREPVPPGGSAPGHRES
ncbi:multidrug efflux RND transporter permease subunit [Pseudomonas sp. HR96]|uniref:multidrug efflux RND transporter permease subunit n=1 Tax=Pseudomonas sp. HR96 TaxID=1027966 RepID=UPI002A76114A|nr:multidrug efflux RND transporter permease subunit [Pseudomonas sp. HR96]WPP02034.1 multidrug efflux RND transporter permease subunit [Pseudomonas sp. HR96]